MTMRESTPFTEAFGRRLREARLGRRLSLREVGERVERSISCLSALENGHSEVGGSTLVRLCRALGRSADWLLGIDAEVGS